MKKNITFIFILLFSVGLSLSAQEKTVSDQELSPQIPLLLPQLHRQALRLGSLQELLNREADQGKAVHQPERLQGPL